MIQQDKIRMMPSDFVKSEGNKARGGGGVIVSVLNLNWV